jgi:hypothetical protein
MMSLALCVVAFVVLLFVNLPWIGALFPKSHP